MFLYKFTTSIRTNKEKDMKHTKHTQQLYSWFLVVILTFVARSASAGDVVVSVNPLQTHQTVEGFGGGVVYYQGWITSHPNKTAIYDTIFNGLGLSALRIGNWAQESDADLSSDVEIVKEAKSRMGSDLILEMSSWSAPISLKANNSLTGSKGGVTASLKKENGSFVYNAFGAWWRRSLEQYQALGVYPDYISIQNEPDMDAEYEATLFNPDESWDIASYGKALSAVYSALKGLPNRPKIMGPEVLGIGWNQTQKYTDKLDKSQLDGYAFHYYHSGVNGNDRYSHPDDYIYSMQGLAADLGDKPMFMTENCSLKDHAQNDPIYLAWTMVNAFNINRLAGYIYWNLTWGDTGGGCVNVGNPGDPSSWANSQGFVVQGEYHALRHFSRFVKRGWICIGVSSNKNDVVTAAFKNPEGTEVSVILVNKGSSSHSVSLAFSSDVPDNGVVVQSVPSQSVWSKRIGSYDKNSDIQLPSFSVTTVALAAVKIPTLSWLNPDSETVWENGSTESVAWSFDGNTPESVDLYWEPSVDVKTVSASSEWSNKDTTFVWKASNALDPSTHIRWAARGAANEWLEYDLATATPISGVIIDETADIGCTVDSFEVQYFDGLKWTAVTGGVTIGSEYKVSFPSVTSDKFRLFIKTSGCININYFGLVPEVKRLATLNGVSSYEWNIPAGYVSKGHFSVSYLGMENQSPDVRLVSKPNFMEGIPAEGDLLLMEDGVLRLTVAEQGTYRLFLTDALGRTVVNQTVVLASGENELRLSGSDRSVLFLRSISPSGVVNKYKILNR